MKHYAWVYVVGTLAGWVAAVSAVLLFANGLTRPDVRVSVTLSGEQLAGVETSGLGYVVEDHATGVFVYSGLFSVLDRVPTRLGEVGLLLLLAGLAWALARQARSFGPVTRAWLITPSRPLTVAAACLVGLGVVPALGRWVAAASVLQQAGEPAGLLPPVSIDVGWIVAGLILLAVSRSTSHGGDEARGWVSVHDSSASSN